MRLLLMDAIMKFVEFFAEFCRLPLLIPKRHVVDQIRQEAAKSAPKYSRTKRGGANWDFKHEIQEQPCNDEIHCGKNNLPTSPSTIIRIVIVRDRI